MHNTILFPFGLEVLFSNKKHYLENSRTQFYSLFMEEVFSQVFRIRSVLKDFTLDF